VTGEAPAVQDGTGSLRSRTTAVLQGMQPASVPGLDEPHRGGDAGIGPATPGFCREIRQMAAKNAQTSARKPARDTQARQAITLELVAQLTPSAGQAEKISTAFALDPVDFDGVREGTEEHVGTMAKLLEPAVNETAMRIHLQRAVGALVGSAHGAATFYTAKVTAARDLTAKLANEDRDEDRDGVLGFDTKAARAREFAAQAGLAAYALYAAATGAVHAYAAITGEDWKPYVAPIDQPRSVSRQAAAAELDALG